MGPNIATKLERFFQAAREKAKKIKGYVVVNIEEMDFLVQDPDVVHVLLRELSGADSAANKNLIFIGTTNNLKAILKIRTEDVYEQASHSGEKNFVDSILEAFRKKRRDPSTNDIDKARMNGSIERRLNPITMQLPDKECVKRLLDHYIRDKTLKNGAQFTIETLPLDNLVGFTSQFIVQKFAAYIRDLISKGETRENILVKAATYIDNNTGLKQNNFNIMVNNTVAKIKEIFEQGREQFNSATDRVLLKIDELKDFLQTKAGVEKLLAIYRNMIRLKTSELLEYRQKLDFLKLARREFSAINKVLQEATQEAITQEYQLNICKLTISRCENYKLFLEKNIEKLTEKVTDLNNQYGALEEENPVKTKLQNDIEKAEANLEADRDKLEKLESKLHLEKSKLDNHEARLEEARKNLVAVQIQQAGLAKSINSWLNLEGNWCVERIDAEISELKNNINHITGASGYSDPSAYTDSMFCRMGDQSGNFYSSNRAPVKELSAFSALNGMIGQLEKLLQAYEIECGPGLSTVVEEAEVTHTGHTSIGK